MESVALVLAAVAWVVWVTMQVWDRKSGRRKGITSDTFVTTMSEIGDRFIEANRTPPEDIEIHRELDKLRLEKDRVYLEATKRALKADPAAALDNFPNLPPKRIRRRPPAASKKK